MVCIYPVLSFSRYGLPHACDRSLSSQAKGYQYQFLPVSVFHSGKRKSLYLYSMKPVPFLRPLCLLHSQREVQSVRMCNNKEFLAFHSGLIPVFGLKSINQTSIPSRLPCGLSFHSVQAFHRAKPQLSTKNLTLGKSVHPILLPQAQSSSEVNFPRWVIPHPEQSRDRPGQGEKETSISL